MRNTVHTEILTIGDELLTGKIIDSNSAYIAGRCEAIGIKTMRHNCVGDDLPELVATILEISNRANVVIVSGGLGPTPDDLTREAAAKAAGVKLDLNLEAFEDIKAFFYQVENPDAWG